MNIFDLGSEGVNTTLDHSVTALSWKNWNELSWILLKMILVWIMFM